MLLQRSFLHPAAGSNTNSRHAGGANSNATRHLILARRPRTACLLFLWPQGAKSVEVNNTDAKGRLCLADALLYLQRLPEGQRPTELIDVGVSNHADCDMMMILRRCARAGGIPQSREHCAGLSRLVGWIRSR
eukprot:SAG11_NODE_2117_length_3792_cov_2.955321_3_plen_133_part_00